MFNSVDSDEDELIELPNFDTVSAFLNEPVFRGQENLSQDVTKQSEKSQITAAEPSKVTERSDTPRKSSIVILHDDEIEEFQRT